MKKILLTIFITISFFISGKSQTKTDSTAIKQAALDYFEGFYFSDTIRFEKALSDDLSKRTEITGSSLSSNRA